ncbi:MAG TPA: serine protease [Rhizomicrobium sp.]|nr:serine protease [Rhizomicrobium sp.]
MLAWLVGVEAVMAQEASPASAKVSVKLTHVYVELPAGAVYAAMSTGGLCIGQTLSETWPGGRAESRLFPLFRAVFKTEMEAAGYKVVTPGEDNLFDEETGSADYEIAGVISSLRVDGCLGDGIYTQIGSAKGTASMTIDWQVYARLRKQLVAHISTSGTSRLDERVQGGQQRLMEAAFRDALHMMAGAPEVDVALNGPKPMKAGFQMPGQQSPIALSGNLKAGPRKIADAAGSVVTIMNSTGSGSGFLVSSDGYVLTDQHVVGDDKTVRVRWPDGLEGLGQVERISKNRDVAIIKTNPRDRAPLTLKRGPVTPGDRVYVIGSPAGKGFEGTVSSGVISADRIIDGLRYIQSDAAMSPGSSGGPLLDEKGEVIGLTEMHYFNQGQVASLNMFTPIGDAMDFLALEQK